MLDVALIGGGLCGLALAHSLQARRTDWALFEARPRLGGRVLTRHSDGPQPGLPLDLGATWYWPAAQPSITRLVADLGLAAMAQPDDGRVLLLDDPNRAPRALAFDPTRGRPSPDAEPRPGALHGGARRLVGGMAALTDALATRLPAARLHRTYALQSITDRGDHVALQLVHDGHLHAVDARRVVLAQRPAFRSGLPLLVESQVSMLFGAGCAPGTPLLQDWAEEPHTCSAADRQDDARGTPHPAYGDARQQAPQWQGRLWFGGSETARGGGGYLEGALGAAARLRRRAAAPPAHRGGQCAARRPARHHRPVPTRLKRLAEAAA